MSDFSTQLGNVEWREVTMPGEANFLIRYLFRPVCLFSLNSDTFAVEVSSAQGGS